MKWTLQSGPEAQADGRYFKDHVSVVKRTFETKMDIPVDANTYVRVAALDNEGNILTYSPAVSKHEQNAIARLEAPPRKYANPFHVAFFAVIGGLLGIILAFVFRHKLRRGISHLIRRSGSFKYQSLPSYS